MTTTKTEGPRTVDDYLALPYTLRVTPDPHGGYVGTVEELPGCITQGESWGEVGEMLRDAMRAWIAVALEDGRTVPVPREHGEPARFLLRLPQTLHQDLQRAAEDEGVSLNQFILYRLSAALGRAPAGLGKPVVLPLSDEGQGGIAISGWMFVPAAPNQEPAEVFKALSQRRSSA